MLPFLRFSIFYFRYVINKIDFAIMVVCDLERPLKDCYSDTGSLIISVIC